MIAQFQTADNAIWMIDIETLQWAQIDKPATDPESKVLQDGELTPLGYGRFSMTPRTKTSEAPGAGLCTVGIMPVAHGETLTLFISVNVPVKNFTMPKPITEIRYEIASEKAVDAPVIPEMAQFPVAGDAVDAETDQVVEADKL